MTRKSAHAFLWDAVVAGNDIIEFSAGRTYSDYMTDRLLRAGIERKLEIMGEAFVNVRRLDLALAARIPELPRSIGLRNVLIHTYATVDDSVVWSIVVEHLPALVASIAALVAEEGAPFSG